MQSVGRAGCTSLAGGSPGLLGPLLMKQLACFAIFTLKISCLLPKVWSSSGLSLALNFEVQVCMWAVIPSSHSVQLVGQDRELQ